jgi:hypothetical protein
VEDQLIVKVVPAYTVVADGVRVAVVVGQIAMM